MLGGAFHRMAYAEWGDAAAPAVLCVHGLTRNGRDFDPLASALADRFRVICPDLPGRGGSDWLPEAKLYEPMTYVQALSHLLAVVGQRVMWVGTSLGGLCGMVLAAMPDNRLTRLVLNDVGPHLPVAALRRMRDYVGKQTVFPDLAALEAHLRKIHAPFGRLSDAQWAHLAQHSARKLQDGRVALHYDPSLAGPLRASMLFDVSMWSLWDKISVPVLAVRGENSDLLLPATVARMERGGARSLTVPAAGHAPALMDAPTIGAVRAFLAEGLEAAGSISV
jgi:pimeloyl-ACP methyl ester carboxylesterase